MKGISAKTLFATAAVSLAALGSTTARAAGVEVLNEGFDNVGGLSGWVQVNNSVPPGSGWFQGSLFPAQSGADNSYAAANFLGAANGSGNVDNWLITPTLNLSGNTVLSFFTRSDDTPGFNDVLEVRYSSGSGADPSGFTTLLATIGGDAGYPSDWTQFSASLDVYGQRRNGGARALVLADAGAGRRPAAPARPHIARGAQPLRRTPCPSKPCSP
jgi:hypothetical protein